VFKIAKTRSVLIFLKSIKSHKLQGCTSTHTKFQRPHPLGWLERSIWKWRVERTHATYRILRASLCPPISLMWREIFIKFIQQLDYCQECWFIALVL